MDPMTWKEMVDRTRELEFALGTEEKEVMGNEKNLQSFKEGLCMQRMI